MSLGLLGVALLLVVVIVMLARSPKFQERWLIREPSSKPGDDLEVKIVVAATCRRVEHSFTASLGAHVNACSMRNHALPLVVTLLLAGCTTAPTDTPTSVVFADTDSDVVAVNSLAVAQSGWQSFGVSYPIEIEVIPGDGDVFIVTQPATAADTDISATEAARQAAAYVGVDLHQFDVLIKFASDVQQVGGASAGGQMALGITVAMWNQVYPDRPMLLNAQVAGTGTIGADGSIGLIGGAIEKAEAAAEADMTTLVLPAGQYGETVERGFRGFTRTVRVDMDPICEDLDIQCVFVATLPELIQAATMASAQA